ncbi:hypothetical protein [Bacteroides rodentium]|uniref:hypothetical protein n=1 Tax=Bacteroides rodentium TaxID=691816 RepID=UPI001FCB2909|nr:hypothetical protein [Bacteroides rodentium]
MCRQAPPFRQRRAPRWQVGVGRDIAVFIEEADVRKEGAATVQAAQQQDVAFAPVGGILRAAQEEGGA